MREKRFRLALLTFCASLFACAPKANFSDYTEKELDLKTAPHKLPEYVLNKKKPKIAVLPFGTALDVARKCNLGAVAQENVMNILVNTGTAEVVERSQLNALMQEVKFSVGVGGDVDVSQLSKLGSGIDYVIVGSIASVDIGTMAAPLIGCTETGTVYISVRVLTFPSGSVLKAITSRGTRVNTREAKITGECKVQDSCGLLSGAIVGAADKIKEDFLMLFPTYGYVYKTMTHAKDPKKRIAFINLGTADGLRAGEKVDIVEFKIEKDPAKGSTIVRESLVAECTILNNELTHDKSVCAIPEDKAQNVLVLHAVRTKPNVGLLRTIQKRVN